MYNTEAMIYANINIMKSVDRTNTWVLEYSNSSIHLSLHETLFVNINKYITDVSTATYIADEICFGDLRNIGENSVESLSSLAFLTLVVILGKVLIVPCKENNP